MSKKKISPALYMTLRPAAVALFKLLFRPKVTGKENIPKNGSVVIAGNHISFWDCFMVMAGTNRCIHFLAKKEIFGNAFLKCFFNAAGLIPVDRQNGDKDALASAKEYLNEGAVIGIFPEGTSRKPDPKELLPFKFGAVKMANDTNTSIVPFTISGQYKIFGKSNIEIVFQPQYTVGNADLAIENEILQNKVRSYIR